MLVRSNFGCKYFAHFLLQCAHFKNPLCNISVLYRRELPTCATDATATCYAACRTELSGLAFDHNARSIFAVYEPQFRQNTNAHDNAAAIMQGYKLLETGCCGSLLMTSDPQLAKSPC
eukprot:5867898-Amphidinium_carterae.1